MCTWALHFSSDCVHCLWSVVLLVFWFTYYWTPDESCAAVSSNHINLFFTCNFCHNVDPIFSRVPMIWNGVEVFEFQKRWRVSLQRRTQLKQLVCCLTDTKVFHQQRDLSGARQAAETTFIQAPPTAAGELRFLVPSCYRLHETTEEYTVACRSGEPTPVVHETGLHGFQYSSVNKWPVEPSWYRTCNKSLKWITKLYNY